MKLPYLVIWRHAVSDRLVQFVTEAIEVGDATADFARACHQIDQRLGTDPWAVGESRDGYRRVLPGKLVTAYYEIYEDVQAVLIIDAVYRPLKPPRLS